MDEMNNYDVMNVEKIAPYSPSNRIETIKFRLDFCWECRRGRNMEMCDIYVSNLQGKQTPEWIHLNSKPTCTAFEDVGH